MKTSRSTSQVLFGFLPFQTVDLEGSIWRVNDWKNPIIRNEVDVASLRREIVRQGAPWRIAGTDDGYVTDVEGGAPITIVSLNDSNGVEVLPFPDIWVCKNRECRRIHDAWDARCPCGGLSKSQLPFVAFHDKCGALKAPYIKRCEEHKQVRITLPGTASASEILFDCPVCGKRVRKGFFAQCSCGQGEMIFNIHRASSVYTPRGIVIVNPPSRERMRAITEAGGPAKALVWVVGGMESQTVEQASPTQDSLRRQLVAQGLPLDIVEKMLAVAGSTPGGITEAGVELPEARRLEAESQAVTLALATLDSRVRITDLASGSDPVSEMGILYRDKYPLALQEAGLASVDLIERFPVLTGQFGFTRGGNPAGEDRLMPFTASRRPGYRVYADIAETEALLIRLSPLRVLNWLRTQQGFDLPDTSDSVTARTSILREAQIPSAHEEVDHTVGADLLRLIHSYAHRFIRIAAVHAGIDRNSLSELLVPLHLGFFVYAAARGDFVLGGLQAVFESELDRLLRSMVHDERRCAMDPGCLKSGGACIGCLHLGEPSCRYFNRFLTRETLFGAKGYLSNPSPH